jgi:muconolactone delta-isomerase
MSEAKEQAQVQAKRPKSVTIDLAHPVSMDGQAVSKLEMRRAKAKDMVEAQSASSNQAEQELHLFARLTGINPEVLGELDMADYGELQRVFSSFLQR